ncbi:hypothetical protein VIBNIAM115_650010 [Vibrio nigripulchritudo AM115]|nr:hypothetical protein VIBNIAM115_650010 [Vibrio nigripulchritudo AM115]
MNIWLTKNYATFEMFIPNKVTSKQLGDEPLYLWDKHETSNDTF